MTTFDDLTSSDARTTLAIAPTPTAAHKLRRVTLRTALVRGGRRRNIDYQVDRILAATQARRCLTLRVGAA